MKMADRLADFAISTSFSDLPPKTVLQAKHCILDCIGVALAGSVDPQLRRIVKGYLDEIGGKRSCTVVGTDLRTSPANAALANGTFGHVLDYDDINWIYKGHPSVVLVPATLAIGELVGSSGKQILTAYLVAFQVMCKLGNAMVEFGDHYERGWHATGTIGTLGATVAAAKLLRLEHEQFVNAIGLAAGSTGGIRRNFGTMAKSFQAGRAAESGVTAALLARREMTSSNTAIEGNMGLIEASTSRYNLERIGSIRNPWGILHKSKGAILKAYPAIGGGVGSIDSMLSLANEHNLSPSQVKSIICEKADFSSFLPGIPKTGLEGKFSIRFWMALALLQRSVQIGDFTDEKVRSPEIVSLMKKVELKTDQRVVPQQAVCVTVKTTDGRSLQKITWPPLGTPENPMSETEVIQKFRHCAEYAGMRTRRINDIVETITHLEKVRSVEDLADLCRINLL